MPIRTASTVHDAADCLDYLAIIRGLENSEFDVVAGTAWMWARAEFADAVDTLFVDEAGQLSLANTLAVAASARNLVLLGDPQQLAQPSQAAHPPGAGASALEQVLGQNLTMPDDAGLFLDRTYRMHPRLCDYTSEVFYDGRLYGVDDLINQRVQGSHRLLTESGLHVIQVVHEGNTNASPEEAHEVVRLVRALLSSSWTDPSGCTSVMTPDKTSWSSPLTTPRVGRSNVPCRMGLSTVFGSARSTSSKDGKHLPSSTRWRHRRLLMRREDSSSCSTSID